MPNEVGASAARRARLQPIFVAAVCLVAAAARIVGISFNLAEDEIFSIQLNSHSLKDVIAGSLIDKTHPPLYNILLHFWIAAFGESAVAARLLTVFMAVGAVSIYFHILQTRVRPLTAICGALVMGLSGFLIYYGQEARPYGLIALVGAANLWAFLRVLEDPDNRHNILAWAASALLLVYSQYFGAIELVVEGGILLSCVPLRSALRALVPAVLASLFVLPWMWSAFHTHWTMAEIGWIERPDLKSLAYFFIGVIGFPPFVSGWLLLGALAALFGVGFRYVLRAGRVSPEFAAFVALAFVPPSVAFVLSYTLGVSIWAPRQLLPSAFAFIIVVAFLVDWLPRNASLFAAAALVLWAGAGAADGFPSNYVPPWNDILPTFANADAHAVFLAEEGHVLRPLRYYGSRLGLRVLDLQDAQVRLPSGTFYYVCRPRYCTQLSRLKRYAVGTTKPLRYPWGNPTRKVRDEVIVYRLASRDHPTGTLNK